jgi:hydrogenase-1 operon protein HyaF
MKPLNIPIRSIGPGSQPVQEEDLQVLDVPLTADVFQMPLIASGSDQIQRAEAAGLIERFVDLLRHYRTGDIAYPRIDVASIDPLTLQVLNQCLGEGEVSAIVAGPQRVEIQETVFAGVWRVRHVGENGRVLNDFLEGCGMPSAVIEGARSNASPDPALAQAPAGTMNSPILIREIAEQALLWLEGAPAHVVNLTLLPLTPEDHQHLNRVFAKGAVMILSRGFGKCRISSTGVRNVWWVQYFNTMDTLILNTIEVVAVPEVACAHQDDIEDSITRLAELAEWLRED